MKNGTNASSRMQRCQAFQVDADGDGGQVALVYPDKNTDPQIWFVDRSGIWSFLTQSFTSYFRLLVLHLGLPTWQHAFTPAGLSPVVREWFNLYAPVRASVNNNTLRALETAYPRITLEPEVWKQGPVQKSASSVTALRGDVDSLKRSRTHLSRAQQHSPLLQRPSK